MDENRLVNPLNPDFTMCMSFYAFSNDIWYQGNATAETTEGHRGWSAQTAGLLGSGPLGDDYDYEPDYGLSDEMKQSIKSAAFQASPSSLGKTARRHRYRGCERIGGPEWLTWLTRASKLP